MTYLIILSLTSFFFAFLLKVLAFYFLIRYFNKRSKFWSVFKPVLVYEIGSFFFLLINPFSLVYFLSPNVPQIYLSALYLFLSFLALFFIFQRIMRRFFVLDFQQAVFVFLLVFIIVSPVLSFARETFNYQAVKNHPDFSEKHERLKEIEDDFFSTRPHTSPEIFWARANKISDIFLKNVLFREIVEITPQNPREMFLERVKELIPSNLLERELSF